MFEIVLFNIILRKIKESIQKVYPTPLQIAIAVAKHLHLTSVVYTQHMHGDAKSLASWALSQIIYRRAAMYLVHITYCDVMTLAIVLLASVNSSVFVCLFVYSTLSTPSGVWKLYIQMWYKMMKGIIAWENYERKMKVK